MTKEEFRRLSDQVIFLDGATGSCLIKAGMARGVCTEQWILENEEVLIQLQREYVDAGSQIVYAPTFGANRVNLQRFGLENRLQELNIRLVELSKGAVEGRAYVAGDISTCGKILGSSGDATYETALDMYREQISLLVKAGVDLIGAETMISIDETVAALEAAGEICDLPVMCSVTVEADGSIFSGGNAVEAAVTFQEMGAAAVGINCSVGPDQLEAIVSNIKAAVDIPVIAKPNAGMPTITDKGEALYSMGPEDFAIHMKKLVDCGARVIGGCCGTTPEYIKAMTKWIR